MLQNVDLSSVLDLGPQAVTFVLAVVAVVGLVLCLIGRKLARAMCMALGLAGGGAIAFAVMPGGGDQQVVFIAIIAGCALGTVLSWLLFRVWMGLAMALMLGLVTTSVALALQGNLPPLVPESGDKLIADVGAAAEQVTDGMLEDD